MKTYLSSVRDYLETIAAPLLQRLSQVPSRALAWGGLALAAVILLSVNMIAATSLRGVKADLTEDRLYTISPGTKSVLATIDEPITARLYFSRKLGEAAPSYARYFERIRSLLEQYRDLSGGKVALEILDPEPFSDAEDRAVASGLRGVRLNAEGEVGYFGLSATNSTDKPRGRELLRTRPRELRRIRSDEAHPRSRQSEEARGRPHHVAAPRWR